MPVDPSWFQTPIFILNFNQVSFLRRQIAWLLRSGYTDITVLDNHSTYPPLLGYYDEMLAGGKIKVVRRDSNEHKRIVWEKHLQDHQGPFVLTTSDVVPDSCCPADVVAHLAAQLDANPQLYKAGLGLRIDNIPEHYAHRHDVLVKQREYWRIPAAMGVFLADIDFTFSLYRGGSEFSYGPAVRTGWPYLARHEPWYSDSTDRTEEELYYEATIKPGRGSWGRSRLPDWLRDACARISRKSPRTLLHLASGRNHFPGWINLDVDREVGADVIFDLNQCDRLKLPFATDSVDGIFVGHSFARIEPVARMLESLHDIAKPGALFVIRVLQARPDEAFNPRRYRHADILGWTGTKQSHASRQKPSDWKLERIKLVASSHAPTPLKPQEALACLGGDGDSVREIVVHLRAMKPARATIAESPDSPLIEVSTSPIDEHSVF